MPRGGARRLPAIIGVLIAAALLGSQGASRAQADSVVTTTAHRFAVIERQIRKLDSRAEMITERYDGVRWRLHLIHLQYLRTTVTLHAAQAQLAYQRAVLAQLLVAQYKSGSAGTLDIVMGASSFTQANNQVTARAQVDGAITDTVEAIKAARDAILLQRQNLRIEHAQARRDERMLARLRHRLLAELRARRRLASQIHAQLLAVQAAERLHQAKSALLATKWLQQDVRMDRSDPGQAMRDEIAIEALQEVGVPYVWGGASPTQGFDCSGLVMWLYARHGIALAHFAASQYAETRQVPIADLRPGDLVFFHHLGHVVIYIGNGYVVQAPHVGGFVEITPLDSTWFMATLVGATEPGQP